MLLFPFYFSIDGIYAGQFKDYKLKPTINNIALSKIPVKNKNKFSFLIKITILVGLIIFSGTVFVLLNKDNKNPTYKKHELKKTTKMNELKLESFFQEIDSLFETLPEKLSETIKKKEGNSKSLTTKKEPVLIQVPVVVRKQVVIKDTIIN